MKNLKNKLLLKGIVFDAVGMATMSVPLIGPFLDLAWAPFAAKKMSEMYPGKKGKLASVLVFLEEILPFTDMVPTFTLMWFYTFIWKKQETPNEIVVEAF
ncbi:MAG TPA: hypothetical protein VFM59_01720 [Salinimicrobium sp.]|nr:hypothetical protein [Salinimicrobium sp.]